MKSVFADTLYWGAVVNPKDQYHRQAMAANKKLEATEELLTEFLDSLADRGSHLRAAGAAAVRRIMGRKNALIVPQSHDSFLAGLSLYEQRADKGYSLVDCISMETIRRHENPGGAHQRSPSRARGVHLPSKMSGGVQRFHRRYATLGTKI